MTYEKTLETITGLRVDSEIKRELLTAILNDSDKVDISKKDADLLKELNSQLNSETNETVKNGDKERPKTIAEMAAAARIIK